MPDGIIYLLHERIIVLNYKEGILAIEKEVICPGYTFEMFKKSKFYTNQDGVRIINLEGLQSIEEHKYTVSIFFRNGIIYMISLICCDKEFTPATEKERKLLHDEILFSHGISGEKEFTWGKVISEYDDRSNISCINLIYNI